MDSILYSKPLQSIMAQKARERADREPEGKTKTEILLYISNNIDKEIKYVDIHGHLREESNIRNKKTILTHLSDLLNDELIQKTPHRPGLPDIYYIPNDFYHFKKLYFYLKENSGRHIEFLRTKYYLTNVQSEEFQVKYLINLFRTSYITYYDLTMGDELWSILRKYSPNDISETYEKSAKRSVENNYGDIVKFFKQHNVDELYGILGNELYYNIDTKQDDNEIFQKLVSGKIDKDILSLSLFCLTIIPKEDKAPVQNILKESPSVVEFILKSDHATPLLIFQIINNHLQPYYNFIDKFNLEKKKKISGLDREEKELLDKLNENPEFGIIRNQNLKGNPLITIIKSLFINDIIIGRTYSGLLTDDLIDYAFSKQMDSDKR